MSSQPPISNTGPALLEERSITGVVVHLLALFTGILGAGLVYLISNRTYTKANARNALNWHLSVLLLTVGAVVTFALGADQMTVGGETMELSLLPAPLDTVFALLGMPLLLITMLAWLLTVIFAIIATIKAIFGTPWKYPFSPEPVE